MGLNVLVTGGAGYLGSVMVGRLLDHGYHVTVLDNLLYGVASLLGHCSHPQFDFVYGDARDESLMRRLLAGQDVIIPLAAIVGMKACQRDPLMAESVNFDAIVLLNRLRSTGQAVVMPCTNSGYGTRSGDVYCTEETPLEPISLYGVTKVKAEAELMSRPNSISLRLATVFGASPRMRLDLLVNDFVYRAMTDGFLVIYEPHFKRNYVHIEDVADCFCCCIERFEDMKDQVYNFGLNDANLSKAELGGAIKNAAPCLDEPVLVLNGDTYLSADHTALVAHHRRVAEGGQILGTLALTRVTDATRYGQVVVGDDDRILRFQEKAPSATTGFVSAGVYVFEPALLDRIPGGGPVSLEKDVFPTLAAEGVLSGCRMPGRFLDMGTPEGLAEMERWLAQRAGAAAGYRG